jgi:hypothetical protein
MPTPARCCRCGSQVLRLVARTKRLYCYEAALSIKHAAIGSGVCALLNDSFGSCRRDSRCHCANDLERLWIKALLRQTDGGGLIPTEMASLGKPPNSGPEYGERAPLVGVMPPSGAYGILKMRGAGYTTARSPMMIAAMIAQHRTDRPVMSIAAWAGGKRCSQSSEVASLSRPCPT